ECRGSTQCKPAGNIGPRRGLHAGKAIIPVVIRGSKYGKLTGLCTNLYAAGEGQRCPGTTHINYPSAPECIVTLCFTGVTCNPLRIASPYPEGDLLTDPISRGIGGHIKPGRFLYQDSFVTGGHQKYPQ